MELCDSLKAFLKGLGSTADEVAESLRKAGIKGSPLLRGYCPVANALKPLCGDFIVLVDSWKVELWKATHQEVGPPVCTLDVTVAVYNFILGFDAQKYPDLIEGVV